jgi:hypothetical protein
MRAVIERLAIEPSLTWIDCQSRKDVLNFWDFDPVAGVGIELGSRRRNPVIWPVRFKDMMSKEYYERIRLSLFRLHYHFLMSSDRRAQYDYVMLVAGPIEVAEWALKQEQLLAAFAQDASLAGTVATGVSGGEMDADSPQEQAAT